MRRRALAGIFLDVALFISSQTSYAADEPSLSIHLVPASYSGCGTIDPGAMDCEDVVVEGDSRTPQFAFVLTSNIGDISGVQFGVGHDLGVRLESWTLCTGGLQISEPAWPDSGTGIAVTWSSVEYPAGADSLLAVGYFSIDSLSAGVVELIPDPRTGAAVYTDALAHSFEIFSFGGADVDGNGGGEAACGGEALWHGAWTDTDGERTWYSNKVVLLLGDHVPLPRRQWSSTIGSSLLDAIGDGVGSWRSRRVVSISDEEAARYPRAARIVELEFGSDIDEHLVADLYESSVDVVWAQPSYRQAVEFYGSQLSEPDDPAYQGGYQWPLQWTGSPDNCLDDVSAPAPCCDDCDVGLEVAWQWARGVESVVVAYFDAGSDMEHPELQDAYLINELEDLNGNGKADLCPPPDGDLDGLPAPGDNDVIDDVMRGWRYVDTPEPYRSWEHVYVPHGTKVAGILAASTNDSYGTASITGKNVGAGATGIRLVQFSAFGSYVSATALVDMFTSAASYGARVFTVSLALGDNPAIVTAVEDLRDDMLFIQASGNDGTTDLSGFARLPGVMAVGGYDCTGGRWVVPPPYKGTLVGSNFGPPIEIVGPADDDNSNVQYSPPYSRSVMTSTSVHSTLDEVCGPPPLDADPSGCFGGTSAAAPHVAATAALILSFADTQSPPVLLSTQQLRNILTHTAEDVLCDPDYPDLDCDCDSPDPDCETALLGWDEYTGYGRVDAGRALTLPIAWISALQLPQPNYARHGEVVHVEWDSYDLNPLNGDLSSGGGHFELHCLIPQPGGADTWLPIDLAIGESVTSYDWVVGAGVPEGSGRRLRLTVVDSGSNENSSYSDEFWIVAETTSTPGQASAPTVASLLVHPNPASQGVSIRFTLPSHGEVVVGVYDVTGRRVRTVIDDVLHKGTHEAYWSGVSDGGDRMPPGAYLVRVQLNGTVLTSRFLTTR